MKYFVFIIFFAASFTSCETQRRVCDCSMDAFAENEEIVDIDLVGFSDKTNLSGGLEADIVKYVNAELSAGYTDEESNVSARKIIKKIKSDYPDFYSQTYRFKIERIYYCTYYKNYCQNSTLTDSAYLSMANEKLDEFSKAFLSSFEQPEQTGVPGEKHGKPEAEEFRKVRLSLVIDYDVSYYDLVVNGKIEPFMISGSELMAEFKTSSNEIIFFMKSKEGDKCRTVKAILDGDLFIKQNYKCY